MPPRLDEAKPVMPASVSIANQAPKVEPSEPGTRSRQTKAGVKPGRSSRITSTLVIFTRAPLPLGGTRPKKISKRYIENTIRNSIPTHSICATGQIGN